MNYDEMVEVIRAKQRGDKVQVHRDEKWEQVNQASWPPDFYRLAYRVAPIPREYWAEILDTGELYVHINNKSLTKGGELIKLREVIE